MAENRKNTSGRPGRHHFSYEKPEQAGKTGRRLLIYMKEHLALLITAVIFLLFSVLLRVSAPALLGAAVTEHLERSYDFRLFSIEMLKLLGIYIGMFVSQAISSLITAWVSNTLIYRMRKDGFERLQRLSLSFYDSAGTGDIISRMTNDIETVYNAFSNGFTQILSGLMSMIGTLIAMFALDVPLSFAVLAVIPIVLVFVISLGRRVKVRAMEHQKQVGLLNSAIEESVGGMKIIQSFNREEEQFRSFERTNSSARDAAIAFFTEAYKMMPMMNLMNGLSLALVIAIGSSLVITRPQIYSIGLISAFILYARQFFEPVRQISNMYNMFQSALAGAERFFQVIDADEMITEPAVPHTLKDPKGSVSFEHVHFAYTPGVPVLSDITFSAASGQTIAIVGPTGAGKTTLVNLLNRFYDVQEGVITIDGIPVGDHRLSDLRSMMGVVLQEPFFFAGTIRENLLFGNPEATEEELRQAARTANAQHFISCLPQEYDTVLTEKGMNLSQGERQLLAITRTILADPKILILDEATSSVDSLTEAHIQQAMKQLMRGKTSFIIAHRLSTIKHADNVLVIHDHRIIEQGTHQQLMAEDGFYARLYQVQFEQQDITEQMDI